MAQPRNDLLDRATYLAIRLGAALMHMLPVNFCLFVARQFGGIWYTIDKRHAARARANLKNCFPEFSDADCDRVARSSVQQLFMLGVEILFTTRLVHIDTWRKYVEVDNIADALKLLLTPNQGMIFLTAHYGNWEILGYTLATLGFETSSVARPLNNPYLNDWLLGVRELRGQKILNKKGVIDDVTGVISAGGAVAFVADQNAGPKGIFVDFFGRKASTYKSIGLLAMQFQTPIVVGCARRTGNDFHFRFTNHDVIYPADWRDQPDPLRYITQRYTTAIEEMVRADPAQYWWMHRRWKTRPRGETPLPYD
jgi:Kdo2-lipid IVA lauroyltransferase/acyltransferase